jgi:chromosomal replication initiator protein
MKDHTTISHAMKKISEILKEDENFKVLLEELSNKVNSYSLKSPKID